MFLQIAFEATNTSSVTALAAELIHPGRFAGFHFFNPVPLMKLVAGISGLETLKRLEIWALLSVGHEAVNAEDVRVSGQSCWARIVYEGWIVSEG